MEVRLEIVVGIMVALRRFVQESFFIVTSWLLHAITKVGNGPLRVFSILPQRR